MDRPTRRTRIVCISDTHNSTVKLPKGDVLIHAGDLTNQGSYSELSRAVQWLEKADFEAKIVIAGNHDITLDSDFYPKHASNFHNQNPQVQTRCRSLLSLSRTIIYLEHSSATVRLTRLNGPRTEFTVFGSPYSPEHGTWAFMYPRTTQRAEAGLDAVGDAGTGGSEHHSAATRPASRSAADLWAAIPLDTDILVTHTPAATHCDDSRGCDELAEALAKVRPRLHVCGHVHQARGAERVRWGTDDPSEPAAAVVVSRELWQDPSPDPASGKMSLVDLTGREGKRPLDFGDPAVRTAGEARTERGEPMHLAADPVPRVTGGSSLPDPGCQNRGVGSADSPSRDEDVDHPGPWGSEVRQDATRQLAQADRPRRRETCVVNCAIVATSWPHTGGKRFNKPIVVDIDLPVWG